MRIAAASQLRDDVPFPAMQNRSEEAAVANDFSEIEPTQRLSQVSFVIEVPYCMRVLKIQDPGIVRLSIAALLLRNKFQALHCPRKPSA